MLAAAETAARKAKNPALADKTHGRARDLAETGKEYALVKADAETLRKQPDSPEASFRWGRFLCLFRDNWKEGLPLVLKGNNAKWKALAQKEQADPAGGAERLDLAEGWLAQAAAERGTARKQMLLHARHWYEQASAKLTELARFKVDKRIREIDLETGDASTPIKPAPEKLIVTGKKYEQSMQAAKTAMDQRRFADAVQSYGEALYWKANDPEAIAGKRQALYASHLAKGNALLEKKRFADAATEFNRALREMPGDTAAQAGLEKAQAMMK
jgi:tetratricopeptide (TPR) repeat protein